MSEIINNREYRRETLKKLIHRLHEGHTVDEVRDDFQNLIEGISPAEISEMEQALIMDGMPVAEVQRLCDVHAAVFKGSIEEIHRPQTVQKPEERPGHPVHTFKKENRAIEKYIDGTLKNAMEAFHRDNSPENTDALLKAVEYLLEIDKHYSRKENLIFPYMEKYDITAPPKVMWGVDDEIRAAVKAVRNDLKDGEGKELILKNLEDVLSRIKEMIFKEENILFPMVLDTFTEDEWLLIEKESSEIGFCFIEQQEAWKPERVNLEQKEQTKGEKAADGYIRFETGLLEIEELSQMLNTLPVDISFIDKDDVVKYFSQPKERIFARTKAVIGRSVQNCHPPASVHVVESILNDFKAGRKDHEDFWIRMGPRLVYIRYFAVRDKEGNYLGTVEVTQDIKGIQELQGEKRIIEG